MEYQKIINFLENTSNQLTKFKTKNWIEINDESHDVYNTVSHIKFKTSVLRSSYYSDYGDVCIVVKGAISIKAQARDNTNNEDK